VWGWGWGGGGWLHASSDTLALPPLLLKLADRRLSRALAMGRSTCRSRLSRRLHLRHLARSSKSRCAKPPRVRIRSAASSSDAAGAPGTFTRGGISTGCHPAEPPKPPPCPPLSLEEAPWATPPSPLRDPLSSARDSPSSPSEKKSLLARGEALLEEPLVAEVAGVDELLEYEGEGETLSGIVSREEKLLDWLGVESLSLESLSVESLCVLGGGMASRRLCSTFSCLTCSAARRALWSLLRACLSLV
jgi:hypothetical protein